MWYILVPAAAAALSLVSKAKTGSYNPAELLTTKPATPAPPTIPSSSATNPAPPTIPSSSATNPAPPTPVVIGPGVVTPGAVPGLGTIDGHGTGVVAGVPVPPVAGLDPNDPNAAAILAAATKAAQQIQQQQDPNATTAAAAAAAESIKQQLIAAMNTPATDRTPEQLALLGGLASLPTT